MIGQLATVLLVPVTAWIAFVIGHRYGVEDTLMVANRALPPPPPDTMPEVFYGERRWPDEIGSVQ
jgi:hypothetical protein